MKSKKDKHKKVKSRSFNKPFVLVILGGLLVPAIAITLYRNQETQVSVSSPTGKPTSTRPADPTPLQNPEPDFNQNSRILTSPVLAGSDRNDWKQFQYKMKLPEGLVPEKGLYSSNKSGFILTLTKKDKYSIVLNYGDGYDAGVCSFTDSPAPTKYVGSIQVEQYFEIRNGMGVLRIPTKIGHVDNTKYTFGACQRTKYGEWSTATKLDQIGIRILTSDASVWKEIETALTSIQIVQL